MLSESRLEKRTLGSINSQTYTDYQDTSNNDTLYNTIKIGLIGAAGYGLYKSGALRSIARPLLELADNIAREGTDRAATIMGTVKQWSHLKHLTPEALERSKIYKYSAPSVSLFRERDSSLFLDLAQDINEMSSARQANFHRMRELMNGTQQDIDLLQKMIRDNQKALPNRRMNYLNTDLHYRMTELRTLEQEAIEKAGAQANQFTAKGIEEFMNFMKLSEKEAAQELKESGYRKLVLGDILEMVHDENGRRLVQKEGVKIDLTSIKNQKGESLLDDINNFFAYASHNYMKDGKKVNALAGGDWKDIVLDSAIRINDAGHTIDYRMSKDSFVSFAHSLANDFKLPLVQFNPFKTLLGFDKIGRRKPLMGLINGNQYDANITRMGGEYSINKWLVDTFGKEYDGKHIAVINGKAYTTNPNGAIQELGSGFKLHDITHADEHYGLKPLANATRQMSGLSMGEAKKYDSLDKYIQELAEQYDKEIELSTFQKAKYKMGEWLDLGYQEIHPDGDNVVLGLDSATSIDEATNKFITWLTNKPFFRTNGFEYDDVQKMIEDVRSHGANYKTVFGRGFDDLKNGNKARMFTTTKEGFKISSAYNYFKEGNTDAALHEMEGFAKQFAVGRNADNTMHEFFTERSGIVWSVFNQLSEGLGSASNLLGLSIDSKRTPITLASNLLLKRALPVYMALKVPGVINYLSEPFFGPGDETGNRDNITKFMMRGVVKPIDIGAHHAMDLVGITKLFKFLGEMTPGSDQISEFPGLYQLGIGQTAEERKDYIENGYDPIRKGRWWGSGNTPFTGGKVMYFRPNIYRRVQADVEFSDSKWGSRQEYYNNAWFPNPVNPLAPLNHFVFNRNYYDKKHYYDRPYLQTAPEGQNIPIIGPLFSSTIGRVISPPQKMHLEYWQNGLQMNPLDELPSSLLTEGKPLDNSKLDINTFNRIEQGTAFNNVAYQNNLYTSAYQAKQVTSRSYIDKAGITFEQRSILPVRTYDRYDTPYEVYSTPSGALNVVDVPNEMNLYNVNQDLQKYSINKILGTNQRVEVSDFSGPGIPVGNDSPAIDNAFIYGLGEQYNWLSDIAGLKGFAVQTFITGSPNQKARIVEDSGYAYSFNNDFWEANMGGLGGGLSEITRRFIPARNKKTEYINPIRNTMPSWMPGSTYFTDFKHGDAYCLSKDTLVLTDKGYIKAKNVKIGDIILTDKGNHYPVQNIAIRPIETNEKSYRLTVSGIDKKIPLEFSENHPILIKHLYRGIPCGGKCKPCLKDCKYDCNNCKSNKWDNTLLEFVKAKDIKIGDAVVFPIPVINNPTTTLNYQYEWQDAPRSPKYIKTGVLTITKDIAWLLGLYLAEGSTAKNKNKQAVRLLFTLHSSETEVANRVCDILEYTFGKRPEIAFRKEYDCLEIILCDAQVARIFNNIIPGNLYEKRIPKEFYHSTKENMINLLLGFMLGDGSIQRNYVTGTTANQQLALDLHKLSMYAGIPCQIIKRNTRQSYEICIHSFNLKDLDLSGLMHKQNKLNFNYTRIPGLLTYTDGQYIYSEITDKQEIKLDYVYGFEVDIDDTFCVIGFATHNTKIDNGEERLPGEGYERLHNIKGLMEFNIGSSSIGYEKDYIIKHMLKADKYKSTFEEDTLEKGNEIHKKIQQSWLDAGLAIDTEQKVEDKRNGIIGWYDAKVRDMSSPTGVAIVDIKSTSAKKLKEIRKSGEPLTHHMRQVNYYLWATGNTQSKGYIHYVDKENLNNTYTVGFNFSQKELETTLKNVHEARQTIRGAVERGEIGRGELYSTLDRFRILADVAPYSQEFKDVSAQLSKEDLSPEEQEEASRIRERIKQQKEPLRVYPYKFRTSNLKTETVTVSKIIDNNTIVTKEYGKQHSIKFAGINVSTSNSEMFDEKRTKNEAARSEIRKYIRPGAKIQIAYDADERNKYSKDSTKSIRAVVYSRGKNVNRNLLERGHAKEKENDDSPAAIRARYTKGEIAFGSAMETITHDVIGKIPFVGSKFMQVRSPYEQYRKREVYGKDFQSWNHPIRDMLIPSIQENIADNKFGGLGGILMGGFLGSMFGKSRFGKIVGTTVGALLPTIGKVAFVAGSTKDRDWRPKRRRDQEKLNEYVDVLKYVKNMRLYEQYKNKAKKEDNFDVEFFMKSKEYSGVQNKLKQQELTDYKRKVKLDFKHRDRYNFKYGDPKYTEKSMDKKQTVSAINKEIAELQSQRKVMKLPANALKAIEFKQAADQTMYGYNPGDSLVNIMTALPKKERQYFKHFMDAPEEEKEKILRIAPSYLRRALQSSWGMKVDKKPSLDEYFRTHGLPDASWIGWDESTDIQDVKVKLVHQNNLDPGEFDIWDDGKQQADETNIPIPMINAKNSPRQVQAKLSQILGKAGYDDIQTSFLESSSGDKTSLFIKRDARNEVSQQIAGLEI